jgi:polyhydroxybutyrate depolymerase
MNFENINRNFIVCIPTGFTSTPNLPVVFNLHGYGSDASQQEFYSRMDETADSNHFIVVYPNGIANSWNSGFQFPYNSSPNDVGFISKIIDTLSALYNVNLNRVYACGMSNGGFQSYRLACDLENRIAAIASVTGSTTELTALNCTLSRKVPVLQIHGTVDPLVPYAGQTGVKSQEDNISFWLGKNTCSSVNDTVQYPNIDVTDSSTVERITYSNCGSGTEVMFYKITGGGHTWPNATFGYIYGPTNRDFDASQEIWDFFNRFTLNGPVSGVEEVASEIEVVVFPNPSEGKYEIRNMKYENEQPVNVSVFDATGRKILEQRAFSSSTEISLTGVGRGIYFLKLEGKDFSASKKLVKE